MIIALKFDKNTYLNIMCKNKKFQKKNKKFAFFDPI